MNAKESGQLTLWQLDRKSKVVHNHDSAYNHSDQSGITSIHWLKDAEMEREELASGSILASSSVAGYISLWKYETQQGKDACTGRLHGYLTFWKDFAIPQSYGEEHDFGKVRDRVC